MALNRQVRAVKNRFITILLVMLGLATAGLPAAKAQAGSGPPESTPEEISSHPDGDPVLGAIGFYQSYLSSLRHTRCQFAPSCSAYAAEAVDHYGLIEGSARAADRLMRCNGAARGIYRRGSDGRLLDAVSGEGRSRFTPRVPVWLLPELNHEPPPAPVGIHLDEEVSFARALSARRDCYRAATEYLRIAHAAGTTDWHGWSHMQTGACYYQNGNWPDAERSYLEGGMLTANGEHARIGRYMAAACRFSAGHYATCRKLLKDGVFENTQDGHTETMAPVLMGFCGLARGDWDGAREDFEQGLLLREDNSGNARLRFLIDRTREGKDLSHRSGTLATALSIVLPGSGQVYAGETRNGLRHLIFNGAFIYTATKLIQDEHYPAGYLMITFGLPFYLGNVFGAGRSARGYNRDRRLEFTARTIQEAGTR